jgi:phage terminase small subunit|nr:MAG TPA: Terminase small subunit [Bacteriophage sp.]DAT66158.1 MAG TPA: Terminase small subunit [Caudoviricetes sp.]
MAKLTAKQQRFVDEYLIDLNATQAAIRAGYTAKYANTNASKLLQNTTIRDMIAKRMAEKEAELIASQDEVLRYLTAVMRGESHAEVVVVEGVGEGCSEARTMQKAPDEKERLKAAELLGKRYALFTEKVETDTDMELNIHVDYGDENG